MANDEHIVHVDNAKIDRSSYFSIKRFVKLNKYPLLVTVGFFLAMSYVSFFHHHYWWENDGILLLRSGEQIIQGDGKNLILVGAGPLGPITYAYLNSFFHNGFYVMKVIQLLSATGLVFCSYYIIRNFADSKIALLAQIFFAFNPRLDFVSILSLDEILPIFLVAISLYFTTKKHMRFPDIILAGIFFGMAFMIRYQTLFIFVSIIIYLLIRNRQIQKNLKCILIITVFFFIAISPIIIYNYNTYDSFLSNSPNLYFSDLYKFQTVEWHDKMKELLNNGLLAGVLLDFPLFLKNYFYNLFYHNSSILFNFGRFDNISLIPLIPFIGIIPVVGGLIYSLKMKLTKSNLFILLTTLLGTALVVFLIGDIKIHFFALIVIPLFALVIANLKKIETRLVLLTILSVIFFCGISLLPLYRSYQLLPILFLFTVLSATFFLNVIPKIYSLIKRTDSQEESKKITLTLVIIILLINIGFTYKLFEITLYNDTYSNIIKEFTKVFQRYEPREEAGYELKNIGSILAKEPNIENNYVMGQNPTISYYANSKFLYTDYTEGRKDDNATIFVNRYNWTQYDIWVSNLSSYPVDIHNLRSPVPDYLVYVPIKADNTTNTWYVDTRPHANWNIFSNPENPQIPKNFKEIYQSNKSGIVVYKIMHKK